MPSPSRRALLRTLGTAAVAAAAGCVGGFDDALAGLRPHVHRRDAPVDDPAGPWPTLGADPRRTGAVATASPPPGDARARPVTPVGLFARSQPAVAGDRAFVGVDRRTTERDGDEFSGLVAVDLTGERRERPAAWRAEAGRATASFTPTVRGRVVYAQVGGTVRALDARDGALYWRTRAGSGGVTPAVAGEDCFTAGDRVVALDAVTGERRWTSEELVAAPAGLAVTGDAVALSCGDGGVGALYGFERADGATRWRYDPVGESYAGVVADGERAYVVGTDGDLHAVGLAGGEEVWTHPLGDPAYERPAVADGTVFAAADGGRVVALDAASGAVRWERRVGVGGTAAPAATGAAVVVVTATRDGERLVVLDRSDGTDLRRTPVPGHDAGRVQPALGDGVAYVVGEGREGTQSFLYAVQ